MRVGNEIGGTIWRIGSGCADEEYVKVGPPHPEFDPAGDAERMACAARWLPVQECPWHWSADARLAALDDEARLALGGPPAIPLDDLVVCHGDACNPNFLLDDDLEPSGYVDVGLMGVADRHADLAPALLSLGWNFAGMPFDDPAPGYVPKPLDDDFLAGYGIPVDVQRLDWYTRLWKAG